MTKAWLPSIITSNPLATGVDLFRKLHGKLQRHSNEQKIEKMACFLHNWEVNTSPGERCVSTETRTRDATPDKNMLFNHEYGHIEPVKWVKTDEMVSLRECIAVR